VSEWRPAETPPETEGHYLGFDAGHGSCTAYWDGAKWKDCFGYHDAPVTHWQPLPQPPR
jgi:hypothetical protein